MMLNTRKLVLTSRTWVCLLLLTVLSCSPANDDTTGSEPARIGAVRQAITDTDGDSMDDAWETSYFGGLSQTGAGDYDSDGMTNLEEYTWSLNPTSNDALDDADGDRFPSVFEVKQGSDPNSAASTPTPNYTVNGAGGGTHTTVSDAVNAASVANGAYQIIAIAPGVYTGNANLSSVSIASSKPKLLMIGLQGADKTVFEGTGSNMGWTISNTAVVAGLTFRKNMTPFYLNGSSKEVRLVDLFIKDNPGGGTASFVHMPGGSAVTLKVSGTTIYNTAGLGALEMWVGSGSTATLTNTVFWGTQTWTLIGTGGSTPTTNYCLVKGATLAGTGNLPGSTDPKIRSDGHLRWDSPLRAAGGTPTQSKTDLDNESRPSSSPDIGVDQFVDYDSDDLADQWEIAKAGNLTTLTSKTQDSDSDGLTNAGEHAAETDPTVADTDGDSVSDGDEVNTYGTSPLKIDTDGDDMPDGWEVTHGLSGTVSNALDDLDGDRYPNIWEYTGSSDPNDVGSVPTPNYTVNGAGGGTHTTVSAAVNAATTANGLYQIIAIESGVYTGSSNLASVVISSSKPKLLIIGLHGAAKTVLEGTGSNMGWTIQNTAVVAGLTFRKNMTPFYMNGSSKEVRLVDLLIKDNPGGSTASFVHMPGGSAMNLKVTGTTVLNNAGVGALEMWVGSGSTATLTNTVFWGSQTWTLIGTGGSTPVTNYCLVKGATLSGTGNLSGSTDPKLTPDGHLRSDSPLRAAGGATAQSRTDLDNESRPSSSPDIGVDQFVDQDADLLADAWEIATTGNLTTLTSGAADADSDGLTNNGEYVSSTNPLSADTDGDGITDGDEVNTYSTNPLATDTDADEMPDKYELDHGLSATIANRFQDYDGDRYPDIFEYKFSTDPSDRASIPTPTYVVNAAGGGTHTTISSAINATNPANGAYQIVGIAAGTYGGSSNLEAVSITTSRPKLLVIGLDGADKTILDGSGTFVGWSVRSAAVIASLTFRSVKKAIELATSNREEVRLVDLVMKGNIGTVDYSSAVHSNTGYPTTLEIVGSTFVDNSNAIWPQIWLGEGTATLQDTLVWSKSTGLMVNNRAGTTLTANNCLVKGQTLTGTGNLAGTLDPKIRSDLRLRSDSPLRGAGANFSASRIDIDGELRPSSAPDIGVDQFNDADADDLPDAYEIAAFGDIDAVDGAADDDLDGITNADEYDLETNLLEPDTDGDGVDDGLELLIGTNPLVADSDDLAGDLNHDGLIDSISVQLGHQPNDTDNDGDGVSNADELLMCTDPLRSDTDGDGVSDNADVFPHDPLMSSLTSDPEDVTAPVITLESPWYAVEQ